MWILVVAAAILLASFLAWMICIRMPGRSHRGALPPATEAQGALEGELRRDVMTLAGEIGERSVLRPEAQRRAAEWIEASLRAAGLEPSIQDGNVAVEIRGSRLPGEIVIVGGHYDSVAGSPGANDNATGVAATLALARRFARAVPERTLRFLAFANEEPPTFQTDSMGSRIDARACRERKEDIVAMLSLETLGCYSDEPRSQQYPIPLLRLVYPDRGDFVTFVGNLSSGSLVRRAIGTFREHASFPSEGASLPAWIPGVDWSDHASYWREGYPAIMVTDTAIFRDPRYHTPYDRTEFVDSERLARVVEGIAAVVEDLAGPFPPR
ncbi:MAG: M28 family peptidase [Planctomycetota bacterium]